MRRKVAKVLSGVSGIAILAGALGVAMAQENAVDGDEEIVVTAQKRSQRIQSVPIAISAYGESFLADKKIDTVDDLIKYTPGMSGQALGPNNPRIPVRGISGNDFGTGSEATLGIYVDEVYAGRITGNVQDLLDVERVEVLKGPQSTLFGRNSTAGAISITRIKPGPDFGGMAKASYGSFDTYAVEGAVNVPLSETLFLRVAGKYRDGDGYADNLVNNLSFPQSRIMSGRAALRWTPSSDVDVTLSVDGNDIEGTFLPYKADRANSLIPLPIFTGEDPNDIFDDHVAQNLSPHDSRDDRSAWNASLNVSWDINENLTLTSISGFRTYDVRFGSDDDGSATTALHLFQDEKSDQYSHEMRLNGEYGTWRWFVGGTVYREDSSVYFAADYDIDLLLGTPPGTFGVLREEGTADGQTTGWAFYGDITFDVTDQVSITGGLRYARDNKEFRINIPDNPTLALLGASNLFFTPSTGGITRKLEDDFDAVLPRIIIDYKISDNFMLYASASRGYRPGGFDTFSFKEPFNPEFVWSYEAGFKSTIFDGAATFNATGFYYDYDDLQVLVPEFGTTVVRNAGSARGYGLEAQLNATFADGFTGFVGVSLLNAEYEEFIRGTVDLKGNKLSRAPGFTFTAGVNYETPIANGWNFIAAADFAYTSRQYLGPLNDFRQIQPYALVGASIGVGQDDGWQVRVIADNLLNRDHLLLNGGLGYPFYANTVSAPPRTFTLEVSTQF
jgi:iron complex outermembrane receptor protein